MITFDHLLWGNANNCLFSPPVRMWQRRIYDCASQTLAVQWKRSSFSSKNPLHSVFLSILSTFTVLSMTITYLIIYLNVFIIISRDRKMALLQLSTAEEAIQSLIDLHNYDMGRGHRLRVSFSKSTIWGSPGAMPAFLSLPQEPQVEFIFTSHSLTPYQKLQWEWPLKEHSLCICSYSCLCMASCYSVLGWIDKNVPYLAK